MVKQTVLVESGSPFATGEDVKHLFRNIDDHIVVAILALHPTIAQLEEAAMRTSGAGDLFAGIRPEQGVVAQIVELAGTDVDQFQDRQP